MSVRLWKPSFERTSTSSSRQETLASSWNGWSSSYVPAGALTARCQPARESRFVATGRVPVDDALARHLVDERADLLQRVLGSGEVVVADCHTNVPQSRA